MVSLALNTWKRGYVLSKNALRLDYKINIGIDLERFENEFIGVITLSNERNLALAFGEHKRPVQNDSDTGTCNGMAKSIKYYQFWMVFVNDGKLMNIGPDKGFILFNEMDFDDIFRAIEFFERKIGPAPVHA